MPSNQTTNYQLSQWVKSDQVRMEDFNADNAKIDAAIKAVHTLAGSKADASALAALSQAVAAHTSTLSKKGNCQVYYTSYVGSPETTRTFTFPHKPLLIVCMSDSLITLSVQGAPKTIGAAQGEYDYYSPTAWSGNSVTWTETNLGMNANNNGRVYHMVALMDAGN